MAGWLKHKTLIVTHMSAMMRRNPAGSFWHRENITYLTTGDYSASAKNRPAAISPRGTGDIFQTKYQRIQSSYDFQRLRMQSELSM